MKVFFLTTYIVFHAWINTLAQSSCPADTFPVPQGNKYQLFYLQRQPNSNTIVVELNVKGDGQVGLDEPVHVFWIRYQDNGKKKELNFIQRKFAFGINSKTVGTNIYDLNFVSYKKMKFRLEKGADNFWRVYATLKDGTRMILRRVYLHINGGSFWNPNVEYVELKGNMPGTYSEVRERISL